MQIIIKDMKESYLSKIVHHIYFTRQMQIIVTIWSEILYQLK